MAAPEERRRRPASKRISQNFGCLRAGANLRMSHGAGDLDHLLVHKAALKPGPDLAPARRTHAGSYPRLLSRFRAAEEPRGVAEPRRSRNLPRTVFKELARIQ